MHTARPCPQVKRRIVESSALCILCIPAALCIPTALACTSLNMSLRCSSDQGALNSSSTNGLPTAAELAAKCAASQLRNLRAAGAGKGRDKAPSGSKD